MTGAAHECAKICHSYNPANLQGDAHSSQEAGHWHEPRKGRIEEQNMDLKARLFLNNKKEKLTMKVRS